MYSSNPERIKQYNLRSRNKWRKYWSTKDPFANKKKKECHKCHIQLCRSSFFRLSSVADGLNPSCKNCLSSKDVKDVDNKRRRERYVRDKQACFKHYGTKCNCCNQEFPIEFLDLDHIRNDGAKHRKELKRTTIYRWIITEGFPTSIQTLCCNCNAGKQRCGGVCPHQTKYKHLLSPVERN